MRKPLQEFGRAFLAVGVLWAVLGLFGGRFWIGELAVNLSFQTGIALLLAAALLLAGRAHKALVALALLLGVLHLAPAVVLRIQAPLGPAEGVPARLAVANLMSGNRDGDALIAWLDSHEADVLVLLEVDGHWSGVLESEAFRSGYPERVIIPRAGQFGIALLSRHPIIHHVVHDYALPSVPYVEAWLDVDGCPLHVLAVHAFPPVTPAALGARDGELDAVAARVVPDALTIVAGDLNATLYSPALRRLRRETGLRDSRRGFGRQPTWMPWLGPLGLDLCQAMVSETIGVVSRFRGPRFGSDHRPVFVDARLDYDACAATGVPDATTPAEEPLEGSTLPIHDERPEDP